MKSILLPVHPEILAYILNGNADILIRKLFPKDYVGWVYLYCAKGSKREYLTDMRKNKPLFNGMFEEPDFFYCNDGMIGSWGREIVNGGVVARFWCDNVEEIKSQVVNCGNDCLHTTKTMNMNELLKTSCLSLKELDSYLGDKNGYAIHISKLEVFDRPKTLYEFKKVTCDNCKNKGMECSVYDCRLTKAPQNYCYIESEE